MEITIKAAAKLNLFLDVVGILDNGYHLINTVYQSVSMYDTLNIFYDTESVNGSTLHITVESTSRLVPLNKNNLAYQAAELFMNHIGRTGEIRILLDKQIPVGAGLAGGSADAAATLIALNTMFNNSLTVSEIDFLAKQIGADVSFCLHGGTCLGKNIGDELEPLNHVDLDIIIIKPKDIFINTNWAYTRYDNLVTKPQERSLDSIVQAIAMQDRKFIIKNLYNCLEYGVMSAYPVLGQYKSKLLSLGCYKVMMSGSGSALYTIVDDEFFAKRILDRLDKSNIDYAYVKSVNQSTLIL